MDYPFSPLPRRKALRPVIPFNFVALPRITILGLVDSGAMGIRISADFADELGIDLSDCPKSTITIGGGTVTGSFAKVGLKFHKHIVNADVHFLQGWNPGHALLGLQGFFEYYDVHVRAQRRTTTLKPSASRGLTSFDD